MADSPTEIRPLWQAAVSALQAGEFVKALPLFRQLAQRRPNDAIVWHHLGFANFQLGNGGAAIEAFERAIALDGGISEYHNNLGLAYKQARRLDDAAQSFLRALVIAPDKPQTLCNLGSVHYLQRRYAEAADCYRAALTANAACAPALDGLGAVALAEGRTDEALGAMREAVKLEPRNPGLRNNLGAALNEAGHHADAEVALRHALELDAGFASAWCNLGYALAMQERYDEAERCCRRAIELAPDDPRAHNNLALVLSEQGHSDAAVDECRRALAIAPAHIDALTNLAIILGDLGRDAEAIEASRAALAIDPDAAPAHLGLARLKKFTADDADFARLRKQEQRLDIFAPQARMLLHFALGKAYEDVASYDAAFAHLAAGNRLKRATLDYDPATQAAAFAELRAMFSAGFIAAHRAQGTADARPIFIIGMPRSGTTLVEQILSSHPAVTAGGELRALESALQARSLSGRRISGLASADAKTCAAIGADYLRRLPATKPGARYVTDKMTGNFLYLGLIHLALPNARVIHCRRDARDTCVSCFSLLFSAGHHYSFDLAELGAYYRLYDELMNHWRKVLPAGSFLDLRYEELVADTEGEVRRLLAHCGLEWNAACLRFFEMPREVRTASHAQVRAPIYSSSIGRWRSFEPHLAPLLQALGGLT